MTSHGLFTKARTPFSHTSISIELLSLVLVSRLAFNEMSDTDDSSATGSVGVYSESEEEDFGVAGGPVEPYRFEPLADEEAGHEASDEEDEDGLTPDILEARQEQLIPVNVW